MIPAEAVDAAFLRIAEHLDDTETESWKDLLRLALEAAAPHMLAEAWGEFAAYAEDQIPGSGRMLRYANPYRPTP